MALVVAVIVVITAVDDVVDDVVDDTVDDTVDVVSVAVVEIGFIELTVIVVKLTWTQ